MKKDNKGQQKKEEKKEKPPEPPKPELNAEQQKLLDSFQAFQGQGLSTEVAAHLACAYYAKEAEVVEPLPAEVPAPIEPGVIAQSEEKPPEAPAEDAEA